jgi:hypothetical protein
MSAPQSADPEIAAATFDAHLRQFFARGRGRGAGWERIDVDALHAVVRIPAMRRHGTEDHYFLRLGAEYYDVWPPTVAFVLRKDSREWVEASPGSRWWPNQQDSPGFSFRLHANYRYADSSERQLVCFSHSFDYYLSGHSPSERERWRQGTHTVTATLSRMAQVLRPPNYLGPSGDRDP